MYDRLLTTRDVAERLNVSRSYVYYLIAKGDLPCIRILHSIRIDPRDLDKYLEDRARIRELVLGPRLPAHASPFSNSPRPTNRERASRLDEDKA